MTNIEISSKDTIFAPSEMVYDYDSTPIVQNKCQSQYPGLVRNFVFNYQPLISQSKIVGSFNLPEKCDPLINIPTKKSHRFGLYSFLGLGIYLNE